MRRHAIIAALSALACGLAGCTSAQLRTSTARQARTLTETQYQQVLDSLAMFCLEPNALPSLVSLKSGSTQVGDTGQLGFLGIAGIDTKFGSSPTVAASRSIVDQWGTAPVTDDNVLKVLRMGYQNAVGKIRWLSEEEANDLGHDLSQQIGTNADISTNLEMLKVLASVHGQGTRDATLPRGGGGGGSSGDIEPIPGAFRSVQYIDKVAEDLIKLDRQLVDTLDEDFLVYKFKQAGLQPVPFPKFELVAQPSTGLAKETRRQVNDIQEELAAIAKLPPHWYHVGGKKDLPKDACFVGHHKSCGREIYVWVCPDGLAALAEFTLSILKLSTTFKETQVVTVPSGIQYSPAFSRPLGGR